MKINIRQFKKWIAALDSGEYKQAHGELQKGNSFCCLGVGCKLFIKPKDQKLIDGELCGTLVPSQPNSPIWLRQINDNFRIRANISLSQLNDKGYTFPEIATVLELVYIHKILD